MTIISTYLNGNTTVTIEKDGTKTREYDNVPSPLHPESIDVKITNYCDMGCNYCFTPEMEVLTIDGNKKISNVEVGEKIYSYNEEHNNVELMSVTDKSEREINETILEFILDNDEIIRCTMNHKLYVKDKGWIKAKNITSKDEFYNIF